MPEDFETPTGLPESPAPEGQVAPVQPEPEIELVEFKNRDWEAAVPRDLVDQFASALKMDPDRLRQSLQIGVDGTRLYESINDERDRLRVAAAEIERMRAERPAPAPPIYQPPAQVRYPTRPAHDDVIGSVGWLAERFEAIAPQLDRLKTIEEMLANTSTSIYESRRAQDEAEERATALGAYSDVSQEWKKNGWDMPDQRTLERKLQQIPLSDDTNATWHDIWNDVAWMVAGPTLIRKQRRQAVLDSQAPNARITIPGGSAPIAGSRPASVRANGDDNAALDAEADAITRQLQGTTAGETLFPQR
jgi:hypothetical protein